MRRLLGERKGLFAGNLGLRLLKDLLPFQGPILVGIAVDLLSGTDRSLFGIDLITNDVTSIIVIAVAMGLLAVAKTAVGYAHTIVAAHMGRHVVEAARRDLAEASMQMALDERRRFNSGDLLDRCLADSKGLRGFTQNVIIRLISNTARAIYPVTFMFLIDPLLAVIVLAVLPLQAGFSGLLQRRLQRQARDARTREAIHTSAVKEAIDGWSSVASVGGQDWITDELKATAAASEDAKLTKKRTTAAIDVVITLCTSVGIAACYAIGGWRIIDSGALDSSSTTAAGALTLGTLTAFIGVARKTYAPFQAFTKIVSSYRTGIVNLERIADVLDAPMIDPRDDGPVLQVSDGDITLENVTFQYHDGTAPTLRELTGRIPGRSLTVITGSSGAGKTTLLRLLMGLEVPNTGRVRIDGQDINEARLSSVQAVMTLVPQEPMLFTGTLGENLLLGLDETTTEELLIACHQAGLLELVRKLPDGLDTEVGSGRHMLSGGQLRRMAIARALLRQPTILLLDEPTTGLDDLNSKQVLETLRNIATTTTVVMVSHRSDPLAASDHHIILRDGAWTTGPSDTDGEPATAPSGNGHNGQRLPEGVIVGHRVLQLSAMGRPIVLNAVDHNDARARLVLVSGHRSDVEPALGLADAILARVAHESGSSIALASIENLNPDAAYSADRRTVLGIDPSTDHLHRLSVETAVFQRAVTDWGAELIIDAGQQSELAGGADVEVRVAYMPASDGSSPSWLVDLVVDMQRRLEPSRYSYRVGLTACEPDSVTAATGIPVVELTAHTAPHVSGDSRSLQALIAAASAVFRAAALSAPGQRTPVG